MTQAGAADTEAKGCGSLAMAHTGSVIAQTGLGSGRTIVAGQGKLSQGHGATNLAVALWCANGSVRARSCRALACAGGGSGGSGLRQG